MSDREYDKKTEEFLKFLDEAMNKMVLCLASFSEYGWGCSIAGPYKCSACGWRCIEDNKIKCIDCDEILLYFIPEKTSAETVAKIDKMVEEGLLKNHADDCLWKSAADFELINHYFEAEFSPAVLAKNYKDRVVLWKKFLKKSDRGGLAYKSVLLKNKLVELDLTEENPLFNVIFENPMSILSFFGWMPIELKDDELVLKCYYCSLTAQKPVFDIITLFRKGKVPVNELDRFYQKSDYIGLPIFSDKRIFDRRENPFSQKNETKKKKISKTGIKKAESKLFCPATAHRKHCAYIHRNEAVETAGVKILCDELKAIECETGSSLMERVDRIVKEL